MNELTLRAVVKAIDKYKPQMNLDNGEELTHLAVKDVVSASRGTANPITVRATLLPILRGEC